MESDVRASIADAQEDPYATPQAPAAYSEGYATGGYRQYAERVPRYTGSAPPADPASGQLDQAPDRAPAEQLPPDRAPTDQVPTDQMTTDQMTTDQMTTDQTPVDQESGQFPPGPTAVQEAAVSQPQPYPADPYAAETPAYGAEQPAYGGEAEARFEPRTNALPTVPPTGGQPSAAPGHEPSIPPSLVSMLDNGYGHHTEPIGRPGYPPGQPAPQRPQPAQPRPARPGAGNPAVLAAVVLTTLLAVVPSVWLVYDAIAGGDRVSASGAVAGTLMLIGLPTLAAGLYPMVGGGAESPDGARAVLRAPLAYLLVGLVLLVAAGLAAS